MSKIIRAAEWKERPMVIEAPKPPKPPKLPGAEDEEMAAGRFDEEAQARMLAEIEAKEQKAQKLLADARKECDALKQQTASDCARMREETQQECEELREDARRAGHEEGLQQGLEEGHAQAEADMAEAIQQANKKAEKTLRDAKEATSYYLSKAEDDVTTIALAIVEKILPQHFIDVPQIILPLVQKALDKIKDQKEINIHVAPAVYDLVLMARDEFRSRLTGAGAELSVTSDESLVPGDCVIETPNGSVDARLQTQIELIRQAVEDMKA